MLGREPRALPLRSGECRQAVVPEADRWWIVQRLCCPNHSSGRRSKEAKLVERVEAVGHTPIGGDLAVDDLVDDDLGLAQSLPSRRK